MSEEKEDFYGQTLLSRLRKCVYDDKSPDGCVVIPYSLAEDILEIITLLSRVNSFLEPRRSRIGRVDYRKEEDR